MKHLHFLPSIFSADKKNLNDQIKLLEKNGFDMLHLDVMDMKFVPNQALDINFINSLSKQSSRKEIHLMEEDPSISIEKLIVKPTDIITFHIEAPIVVDDIIDQIKAKPAKVGLAINPETSIDSVLPYLGKVDLILLMTVFPGFSGQAFIDQSYVKAEKLVAEIKKIKREIMIAVDGGIGYDEIRKLKAIGINTFVLGTKSLFIKDKSLEENIIEFNRFRAGLEQSAV